MTVDYKDIKRLYRYIDRISLPSKPVAKKSLGLIVDIHHMIHCSNWTIEDDAKAEKFATSKITESVNLLSSYYRIPQPRVFGTGEAQQSIDPIVLSAFREYSEALTYALYHPYYEDLTKSVILHNIFNILAEDASILDVIEFARGIYHEFHHHIVVYGCVHRLKFSAEYMQKLILGIDDVHEYVEDAAVYYSTRMLDRAEAFTTYSADKHT